MEGAVEVDDASAKNTNYEARLQTSADGFVIHRFGRFFEEALEHPPFFGERN